MKLFYIKGSFFYNTLNEDIIKAPLFLSKSRKFNFRLPCVYLGSWLVITVQNMWSMSVSCLWELRDNYDVKENKRMPMLPSWSKEKRYIIRGLYRGVQRERRTTYCEKPSQWNISWMVSHAWSTIRISQSNLAREDTGVRGVFRRGYINASQFLSVWVLTRNIFQRNTHMER